MKPFFKILIIVITLMDCNLSAQKKYNYPETMKLNVYDTLHGIVIEDQYRWLENLNSQEVKDWRKKQEEFTDKYLHENKYWNKVKSRLIELQNYDLYTIPQIANGKYFYTQTLAGENKARIIMYDVKSDQAEIVIDGRKIFSDSTNFGGLTNGRTPLFSASPNGEKLIYSTAKEQSRWYSLEIMDLKNYKTFPEKISGLNTLGSSIAWNKNSSGFYYIKFDTPQAGMEATAAAENPQIFFHEIGTGQNEDVLIWHNPDQKNWIYFIQTSEDGKYLIITVNEGSSTETKIFYKELSSPESQIKQLLKNVNAGYTYLGSEDNIFYFYTNHNAPNGRIISSDINKSGNIKELVPQMEESISGLSQVGGNAIGYFGKKFVLLYTKDGNPFVKIFDNTGKFLTKTDLPKGGTIWGGFSGRQNYDKVFFQFLGLVDPSSLFVLDLNSGKYELFKRSTLPNFNPDLFEVSQVFYESKDGTKVPMFIAHKKELKLDGNNPALLYAYGQFGWISFMWYQPHIISFLEMGGIYAQPSIRGGGVYGEPWHKAGIGLKEQNSVDDYISAIDWLIDNKYTSSSKFIGTGGSASAPLIGSVINQRPDLLKAAIIDRPALDMIRFHKFTIAKFWIQEFGSPENKDEFEILFSLSPYHNLKKGNCYPSVLIMSGDKDEITPPFHAYKYTAKLQESQDCKDNIVLLKNMKNAGHNFGADFETNVDSRTSEIVFIIKTLGLKYKE